MRVGWTTAVVMAALAGTALVAGTRPGTSMAAATRPGPAVERARFLMGTRLVIETSGPGAPQAIERAFAEVDRLEQVMSNWRADSEVSRLNRDAAERPVTISADLFAAVAAALAWAKKTDGTFDPTVEPLVRRLGLRGEEGRLPGTAPEPPAAGAAPVGWRLVEADPETRRVRFLVRGVGIDFGGIGKGIALDAAAALLRREGMTAARLDFGGQVLVFGRGPDHGGWSIGLSDPRGREAVVDAFVLRSGSLAASGNVERPDGDGGRVPHLFDPARGAPAVFDGSVTVIAPDATAADALSTALFVMGPERGLAYAAAHDLDVLYLRRDRDGALVRRGRGAFLPAPATSFPTTRSPEGSGGPHS